MLDLIICELIKLKRKKFFLLTIFAATLFPIPSVLIMKHSNFDFNNMYSLMMLTGEFLLLPCVLGIMESLLFFSERDSNTLKNFLIVPVSKAKFVLAKLLVLMLMSIFYSLVATLATIIGGVMVADVNMVFEKNILSICVGFFVSVAIIPMVAIILLFAKNQMIACILGCAYAIINYVFVWNLGEMSTYKLALLPLAATYRFFLPSLAVVRTQYVLEVSMKSVEYIPAILSVGVMSLVVTICAFKHKFIRRE